MKNFRLFLAEASLEHIKKKFVDKFSKINIYEFDDKISIDLIIATEKGNGFGTELMNEICKYADSKQKTIILSPSDEFGSSKEQLVKFYKKFGFIKNKGKNKIFGIFESMYRLPL